MISAKMIMILLCFEAYQFLDMESMYRTIPFSGSLTKSYVFIARMSPNFAGGKYIRIVISQVRRFVGL